MQANDIYEAQKRLIEGENVNISEPNILRDFIQIVIKIILILAVVYFSFMVISGIIIKMLNVEQQIKLENRLTEFISISSSDFAKEDKVKIDKIKNKILNIDKNFPKTSNLDIKLHPNKEKNALCLPNGNIYITTSLYQKVKNDEQMLFFIIAHEMGHYKHKDHIMNLRKSVASFVVVMLTSVATNNNKVGNIVSSTIELSDYNYSRGVEAKADKYAAKLLLKEYGTVDGAIRVFELLKDKDYPNFLYIFSTHPSTDNRIEYLRGMK